MPNSNMPQGGPPRSFLSPIVAAFAILLAAVLPLPAQSQSGGASASDKWDITVAPYLMIPWMDGKTAVRGHEVEVNVAPKEVFSNLQFGAMGYFEARKSQWGVGVDAVYMALGTTVERVPLLGSQANADVDFNQGAYTFTVLRQLNSKVDFLAGARWNILRSKIGFKGPIQSNFEQDKQWVDPIVGIKIEQPLGGRFSFSMQGDIGGFGVGSKFAWQLFPVLGAQVGKRTTLGIGYRVLSADYSNGSQATLFKYNVITQAFVLGAAFHY